MWLLAAPPFSHAQSAPRPLLPTYTADGALELPAGFRQWIFVGSSLGLSYSQGTGGGEMFHHTLMEPTAYEHFRRTGEFREGTMFALLLHGTGEGVLPARQGRFASSMQVLEMAVKDSARNVGSWAYYGFNDRNGLRASARPFPARSCQSCHVEHAAHDNVFLQFYPLLAEVAPAGTVSTSPRSATNAAAVPPNAVADAPAPRAGTAMQEAADAAEPEIRLALAGLDPVHLVDGHEEMGKPEIVIVFKGLRYQFVSEPSRYTFSTDPERYAIQNETCPMFPGVPIDPAVISIYQGKIYAFASPSCVADFEADPVAALSAAQP